MLWYYEQSLIHSSVEYIISTVCNAAGVDLAQTYWVVCDIDKYAALYCKKNRLLL